MKSDRLRSPIHWFGGKGNLRAQLLPLIPPHKTYVEPFGGGASLLFAKEPSPIEVYNDMDSGLVNFFRVLRDPERFTRFYHLVAFTPYSREECYYCRETWESCEDEVERAYRWYVVARMSFSGIFGNSWSSVVTTTRRGMAESTSKWLSTLEMLPRIHERLMRVEIEHMDFRHVIERYDTLDTCFYLDPPYVPETRRSGRYRCDMSPEDHEDLVALLLKIKGKALLSGYQNPIYKPLEDAGWSRKDIETACHAVGRTVAAGIRGEGSAREKQRRVESVWISPSAVQPRNMEKMEL